MEALIKDNVPYDTIGSKYGVSGNAVRKAARKLGIELPKRREINPNETFNRGKCSVKPKNKKRSRSNDVDSYVLQQDEKISLIKYPNKRGKRVLRKCKHCGCVFETLAIRVRSKGEYFCSAKCYSDYLKDNAMLEEERRQRQIMYQKKCKYGLTESEYKDLFIKQNNKCAICGCNFDDNRKGFVDHSHATKKVRGLLCSRCNTLLGMANDNISILENAIKYLKKTNGHEIGLIGNGLV